MTSIPLYPEDKPHCTRCELHEQARTVGIRTVLYPTTKFSKSPEVPQTVLIIGQNPGFNEDQQGKPFVGRSGDILKKSYIGGIKLEQRATIYLGNGVRCHTTNNQPPKPKHYRECNQYLIQDLQIIKPTIILTLGAPATTSFYKNILGIPKISLTKSFTLNGNLYTPDDHKIDQVGSFNLFSTYHPAAVMRNNNHINSVHSHMELVSDCIDGTMASPSKPSIVPSRSPK
jgi:uracil-DNA glycosylase family 4